MAAEIHVPELGESVADATVGRWLKQEGEAVTSGEALVELETDKINFEVEAEQDGVLESISKGEGETVNVGEVIGTIGEGNGAAPPKSQRKSSRRPNRSSPGGGRGRGADRGVQRPQGGRGRRWPRLAVREEVGPGVRGWTSPRSPVPVRAGASRATTWNV